MEALPDISKGFGCYVPKFSENIIFPNIFVLFPLFVLLLNKDLGFMCVGLSSLPNVDPMTIHKTN